MSGFTICSETLVKSLFIANHLAAVALDAALHSAVSIQDRQCSAQGLQSATLQEFHFISLCSTGQVVYPLKFLVKNGVHILVSIFLYIAEGCMKIPFLLECRRLTLGIKFDFFSSSALIECGNITNKKEK